MIGSDYPDAPQFENEEGIEQLVAFDDKFTIVEEIDLEVKLGCRANEDLKEHGESLIDL